MDPNSYQQELKKLQNEVLQIENSTLTGNTPTETTSVIKKYLYYVGILVFNFVLLVIVKPKIILKIDKINNTPTIVVDKLRFAILYIVMSAITILLYIVYNRLKKT